MARLGILLGSGLLALALSGAPPAAGQPSLPPPALNLSLPGPFPGTPLETDKAALAAAIAALPAPEGAPAQMIFQENRFDFDAAGRITFQRHWIYRILRAEGLRDWGVSQVRYSPWHQQKPVPRVRVIDPDLSERRFEASSYAEKPASEGREDLFGERRVLELKLPVAVGSIVEEKVEVADVTPYFGAGTTLRHYAALYVPVHRGRLVLEAPTRLPLRYGVRLLPGVEPKTTVQNGRVRLDFDYAGLAAATAVETGVPAHRPRFPQVAFSTGRDWQSVAAAYHREVEQALAGAALDGWPRPPAALARSAKAAFLLAALQERVKTSNLELGAGPVAPRRPDEVARSGRGDGKDIATLMVALLRRSGIEARVALLSSGFGPDCEPKLPGLGLFNHAVVLLPAAGAEPALWLDPSVPFVRAGELPLPAQGRYALVADPATAELTSTPATKSADNRTEETREVYFADYGLGRIVERSRHWGSADRSQRQVTAGLEPEVRRRGYQAYARTVHGASALGKLQESDPADLSQPFTLVVEALGSSRVRTDFDQARLEIPLGELLRRLPDVFRLETLPPRQEEYVFQEPYAAAWHYEIHLPPGFSAGQLPPPREIELGPGRLRSAFTAEGRMVRGELSFDVGQRLLSAHQFEAMHRAVRELASGGAPLVLGFPHQSQQLLQSGDRRQALGTLRAAVAAEPQRVSHRLRLARLLLDLGFHFEAQRQARESVRQAPDLAAAHFVLGRALSFDELGRQFSPYADLEAARAELARAAELEASDPLIAEELARLDAASARLEALAAPREELHPGDPQTPLARLLLAHLAGDGEAASSLLVPRVRELVGPEVLAPLTRWLDEPGTRRDDADPLADWSVRIAPRPSGAPHLGYRIAFADRPGAHVYLTRAGGSLLIAATSEEPALLGWEALARLDAGDPEGAWRWLDWAREDVAAAAEKAGAADPLGPRRWLELWHGEKEEPERGRLARARIAAAALAAPLDRGGRILVELDVVESPVLAVEIARAAAREAAGRFAELEQEAALLLAAHPDSRRARAFHFAALRGLGNWDALENAARARLAQHPDDPEALRALADWAAQVGAVARAREPLRRLGELGQLESWDGIRLIFAALAAGDKEALDEAERLTGQLPPGSGLLAARAALAAEKGLVEKARQLIREAADYRPLKAPRSEDQYITGRLAEALGLADVARDTYQRLPPPGQAGPFSFAVLGRQRLR